MSSPRCLSLAALICDQVAELSHAVTGYIALERFVLPAYADEKNASVAPSRGELCALVQALNAAVLRHIDTLAMAMAVLHAEMSGGEAQDR
ncbi:hypothetical protein [Hydrogenophaga sp.]|uniref:hypothetical protein n=1 Tax=Hydrogenophaga sp. TaxID=1904254 RepID=UPI0027170ECB|nr:hypothetical protein [Hydrogenophaga sp.]MDO9436613.1 hypothetical protein [Hydrogenophaga sp.]